MKSLQKLADGHWRYFEQGQSVDVFVAANATEPEVIAVIQEAKEPRDVARPKRRVGTFREFMALFERHEQFAVKQASIQNPEIGLWYDRAMGGPSFSLDHPETSYGLGALVAASLLTQERMNEILDADFDAVGA